MDWTNSSLYQNLIPTPIPMTNQDNNQNKSSILDVLSGNESVKVSVSVDWLTIGVLVAAILAAGTMLIYISRKIK